MEKKPIKRLVIESPDLAFNMTRAESIFAGGMSKEFSTIVAFYMDYHLEEASDESPHVETIVNAYDIFVEAMIQQVHGYIYHCSNSIRLNIWQIARFCEKYPEYLNPRENGYTLFIFLDDNGYPGSEKVASIKKTPAGLRADTFYIENRSEFKNPRFIVPEIELRIKKIV